MSDIVVISSNSHRHLRGNPDFMEWLTSNGVDPNLTQSVAIDVEDPDVMTVTLYRLNSEGLKFVEGRKVATEFKDVRIVVPFPMRFLDPRTAR